MKKNSVLLLLFFILCGCQPDALYRDKRIMLGTFVRVVSSDKRASVIAFGEIKRIEALLSKYNPQSEISRLNRTGITQISPQTAYAIGRAREFWLASNGAFDITIGPLSDIWGFTDKKYRYPEKEEIRAALERVGTDKIIFNNLDNVIQFGISGMEADLGGIAKGYAVDCAVARLKEAGVKSCLIAAGGDIYCLGSNAGKPWKVAIRHPRHKGFVEMLELKDRAVSTSGDYEQYFYKDGRRFAHIFNPRTGYPASSGVVAVTVTADDCLASDALATCIFVLGKSKGEELVKKFPGAQARIIEEQDVR